jgi:2-dehydropantoate 2-reductase
MRQVPHYLLIGNGRVSRHFQYYFSLLNISFTLWHRGLSLTKLNEQLKYCTHILILISDDAIERFITENIKNTTALCIHFSGSLVTEQAYGAHPLMTFSNNLYSKEHYLTIHFVIDADAPHFEILLPDVPNHHSRLQKTLKEKYHALCVLSGNFSCMLWQKLFSSLEHEFNIPQLAAHPFLRQQTQNILDHYQAALTGPLVRDDSKTINKNLSALAEDSFQQVYQSFVSCYQMQNKKVNL